MDSNTLSGRARPPFPTTDILPALLAVADHAIFLTDPVGVIEVFSRGAQQMLGYRPEEVLGRRAFEVFHDPVEVSARAAEAGLEPDFSVIAADARTDESVARRWTFVRADGSTLPVSLTVTIIPDQAGEPVGYLGIARDLTDEQRAREDLARSAHRFSAVFNASPVPTAITRIADGTILMANPACLDILGWTADEFIGRTISEVRFWAYPERRQIMVDRLRADGRIRDMEEDIRTRDGEIKRVLTSIERIEFEGQPCLVGLFYDITERARLEAALKEGEERLRAFLDNAPAIVHAKDTAGRYTLINRRFEEDLGLPSAAVLGKTVHDLFPALAEAISDSEQRVIAEGVTVESEETIANAAGELRTFRYLKFPLRSASGQIHGVGSIATDVTEARRAAEALRESDERFRQLAESIDIGFVLRGVDPFRVLYANSFLEQITGVTMAEVQSNPEALLRVIHPDDRSVIAARLTAAAPDEAVDLEYRILKADGTVRWHRSRTRPVRTDSGRVTRVASTVEDVTQLKEADLALEQARADAERANRAKSEFLSRMSHELRTPLNAILGFGELLDLDDLTADQRDSVAHIRTGGRHLLTLINEVLDIARIESGQLPLSLEPVAIDEVLREGLGLLGPLAAARGVRLGLVGQPCRVQVVADRQRLKQVILNLLSNAVKYNRVGGAVRLVCEPKNDLLRISVIDTGIGIAQENLDRLFTPFERLGAEQSDVEGTGLGLALSKRLVEAMGGAVGANSEVGRGSTFWIELQLAAEVPQREADRESKAGPALEKDQTRAVGTVLYVEDNISNLRLLERIVARRPGVTLVSAMQGSLGLDLALQHRPDLILLDLNLPDIPGDELLRRLRTDPITAAIPIAVVSADATPGQIERLRANGAVEYLTKPIEVARLLALMDAVMGPSRASAPEAPDSRVADSHVLDPGQLAELRGLDADGEGLRALAQTFLQTATAQAGEVATAVQRADPEGVRSAAHKLHGAASTFGPHALNAMLAKIEDGAGRGVLPSPEELADFQRLLSVALQAIAELVEEPDPDPASQARRSASNSGEGIGRQNR